MLKLDVFLCCLFRFVLAIAGKLCVFVGTPLWESAIEADIKKIGAGWLCVEGKFMQHGQGILRNFPQRNFPRCPLKKVCLNGKATWATHSTILLELPPQTPKYVKADCCPC